jgi:hypothetical protein
MHTCTFLHQGLRAGPSTRRYLSVLFEILQQRVIASEMTLAFLMYLQGTKREFQNQGHRHLRRPEVEICYLRRLNVSPSRLNLSPANPLRIGFGSQRGAVYIGVVPSGLVMHLPMVPAQESVSVQNPLGRMAQGLAGWVGGDILLSQKRASKESQPHTGAELGETYTAMGRDYQISRPCHLS